MVDAADVHQPQSIFSIGLRDFLNQQEDCSRAAAQEEEEEEEENDEASAPHGRWAWEDAEDTEPPSPSPKT
eukprot:496944-Rhodomonas_salina.1